MVKKVGVKHHDGRVRASGGMGSRCRLRVGAHCSNIRNKGSPSDKLMLFLLLTCSWRVNAQSVVMVANNVVTKKDILE